MILRSYIIECIGMINAIYKVIMLEIRWNKINEVSKIKNLTNQESETLAYVIDLFNLILDHYADMNAPQLNAFLNKIDNYLGALHYLVR